MTGVLIIGSGVAGLAAARDLSLRGIEVVRTDAAAAPGPEACSWWAGGMLAPFCEAASAEEPVLRLGREAACQREDQAIGLVQDASRMLDIGGSVIVGGDFNIQAPGRVPRVGSDPAVDCEPQGSCNGVCGPDAADGYDDSISILLGGLDGARLLSQDLPETFVAAFFPGSAIDHLLVAGPAAAGFSEATTPDVEGDEFAGSDHRPVVTALAAPSPGSREARAKSLVEEIRMRLEELEDLIAP